MLAVGEAVFLSGAHQFQMVSCESTHRLHYVDCPSTLTDSRARESKTRLCFQLIIKFYGRYFNNPDLCYVVRKIYILLGVL